MKKILAFVIALLFAGSLAASAFATSLSPIDGAFTGAGTFTVKKGTLTIICNVAVTGHVTNGIGTVDTATFSGGAAGLCAALFKTGSWTITATGPGTATISGFSVNIVPLGTCGPGNVSATISNTGLISFSNTMPPDCQISGSVQTVPPVIIVPFP